MRKILEPDDSDAMKLLLLNIKLYVLIPRRLLVGEKNTRVVKRTCTLPDNEEYISLTLSLLQLGLSEGK